MGEAVKQKFRIQPLFAIYATFCKIADKMKQTMTTQNIM